MAELYAGVDRAFSPGFRAGRRAILTKACGRSFQIVAGDHGDSFATVRLIAARAEGGGYYDYFRGRVMFPIRDHSGRTVALGGRVLPGGYATNLGKYVDEHEAPVSRRTA